MSAVPQTATLIGLTPAVLAEARKEAAHSKRKAVEILEEQLALAPDEFIHALGSLVRWPVLPMARLRELAPAFDLLPFAEAAQHECIAFRDTDANVLVVSGDPFALEWQAWAQERIGGPRAPHRCRGVSGACRRRGKGHG